MHNWLSRRYIEKMIVKVRLVESEVYIISSVVKFFKLENS